MACIAAIAGLLAGCAAPPADPSLTNAVMTVTGEAADFKFTYRAVAPELYVDQALTIENLSPLGKAPTLEFTALDAAGLPLHDVAVKTAYGADRGVLVVPAHASVSDWLLFPGAQDRPVAGIAIRVKAVAELLGTTEPALPRMELIDDGRSYRLTNTEDVPVAVRVVIVTLNGQGIGHARQVARVYRVADRVAIEAHGEQIVPIRKSLRGSMAAYPSRYFVR